MYFHKILGIRGAFEQLLAHDVTPASVLRKLGLPGLLLLDSDAWIDRRSSLRLGIELALATGDPLAGLHATEARTLDDYGSWGDGILAATTLRSAISAASTHIGMLQSGTRIALRSDDVDAHLSIVFEGELEEDTRQLELGNLVTLRQLVDLAVEPVSAETRFTFEKPRAVDELERVFGPRLVFGADEPALVFRRGALDLPLRRSRRAPLPSPRRASANAQRETGRAVLEALHELIELERPTVSGVAAALSMKVRTLQRHLAVYGLTFEDVLGEFRHRCAMDYLTEDRYSITEIAFRLGYSDSAHFTRAFRRWTGTSPSRVLEERKRGRLATHPPR